MTLKERVSIVRPASAFYWAKIKNKFLINKIASFVIFGTLLPATIVPFHGTASTSSDFESQLKMDTNSPRIVLVEDLIPQVMPGESKVQREAREKAEAQAARAEAEAKARAEAQKRQTIARGSRVYSDPSTFDEIYARAQAAYGVDARLLKAIHMVETGCSGSTLRSNPSGATGPMQFLPSTWRRHGVDGNGDGVADIGNVEDAIFSAAAYLRACGYPDVRKALWGYNPSSSYYNKVMGIARSFGM